MSDLPPAQQFSFDVDHSGDVLVVRCHGKLVSGTNDRLYNGVKKLIPDNKRIVLDLCDLSHMDSMGLGTLARLYVHAKGQGCSLELLNLSTGIRHMLSVTNMLSVFTVVGEQGIKIG
jgi:anti-sigma B factor antagonist